MSEHPALEMPAVRPLTQNDADDLLTLWNRSASFDPCTAGLIEEKIWQDPDHDPEKAFVFSDQNRLLGFVTGVARRPDTGTEPIGYIKLLAVDPNHARKGIGSRLLEAVEQVLAASGVGRIRVAESAPNYLTPGVDLRYRAALRFFDHHGYRPLAEACNMRVSLADRAFETAEAQRRLQDAGIEVRRATTRDRAELIRLAREFGGRWDAEVTRSLAHEPPLVHIARRGQDLLGFAASEGNNSGTGWFGPMGTTEAARGLGIGRVLLYRCLSDLAAMGFSEAIIPWVGPVAFYARHVGATIDRRFQRLEKILTP